MIIGQGIDCTRKRFMRVIVNKQPFTQYPHLSRMLEEVEAMYKKIQRISECLHFKDLNLADEQLFLDTIRGVNRDCVRFLEQQGGERLGKRQRQAPEESGLERREKVDNWDGMAIDGEPMGSSIATGSTAERICEPRRAQAPEAAADQSDQQRCNRFKTFVELWIVAACPCSCSTRSQHRMSAWSSCASSQHLYRSRGVI